MRPSSHPGSSSASRRLKRLKDLGRDRRQYGWAFVAQAFSSATTLGLTLLGARALGPSGLGVIVMSFAAYLLVVSFQRSLITTPLVAVSSALAAAGRTRAAASGLTVVLLWGASLTLVFVLIGSTLSGAIAEGLLLAAPWVVPALVHDYCRTVLFRDNRPRAGTLNDALWFSAMAVAAPFALAAGTTWAVMACWGIGAWCGAVSGAVQLRLRPDTIRSGLRWWWTRAFRLGRWLALQQGIFYVSGYVSILALIKLVGLSAVGGLRAAESVFAPFSLIGPAMALAGLPAMARSLSTSLNDARRLAWILSAASCVLAGSYAIIMVLLGGDVLRLFFGDEFAQFSDLVWPLGAWQIAVAGALGFTLLLGAQQRGSAVALAGGLGSVSQSMLIIVLAWSHGLVGAAWAYAGGAAVGTVMSVYLAMGQPKRSHPHGEPVDREATTEARG